MPRIPIDPGAVLGIAKEVKAAAEDFRPLLVGGAPGPAAALRRLLVEGGDPDAVRDVSGRELVGYDLEGAEALVYVIEGGAPTPQEEAALRLAERRGVGVVCVLLGAGDEVPDVPYVPATDVLATAPGESLPLERIAERIAALDGAKPYALAARLPVLRPAVCMKIVRSFSKKNGILGAAIFVPGADFPVLTLNQIRMVFRIAAAHGESIDRERALELLAVVGAGFGFRALARQALALLPGPGWAYKGGIAYAGTTAIGEAAIAYFEAGGPRGLADAVRSWS